jgi:hypothetical protein
MLNKLRRALYEERPKKKTVILQHDNANTHTARLTLQTIQKKGCELLSYPPHSPDLAPSDYHLLGSLKDHLRGHHSETDEAVQETVRNWLRGAVTDFNSRDMHRSGWIFCRKVIKDAYILLTSFVFVCIPSFRCRINVPITFGKTVIASIVSPLTVGS